MPKTTASGEGFASHAAMDDEHSERSAVLVAFALGAIAGLGSWRRRRATR